MCARVCVFIAACPCFVCALPCLCVLVHSRSQVSPLPPSHDCLSPLLVLLFSPCTTLQNMDTSMSSSFLLSAVQSVRSPHLSTSHLTRQTSHVTPHNSHVTPHTSQTQPHVTSKAFDILSRSPTALLCPNTAVTAVDAEMLTPRKIALQAGHAACANFIAQVHILRRETCARTHTRTRTHAHTRTRAHAHTHTRAHAHTRTHDLLVS